MKYNLKTAIRIVSEEDRQELIPFFEAIKADCNVIFKWDMNNIKIGDTWYLDKDGCMDWDNPLVSSTSDYTIIEGIPENWREEMGKPETELQSKINQLETENKELREFLETVYKSLMTYGKHPIIDEQYRKIKAKQLLNN